MPGDKVKLETMASMKSIPWTRRCEDFAVVMRVTAPTGTRTERSRSGGVDLVAVLDISEGMNEENKLESMKQGMVFVIDKLGPDDRISIVSFNDEVQRLTELSVMSDENRTIARTEVNRLTAGGGTNLSAAMEAAATILGQRGEEERSHRVGRVMFLSNGDVDDENAEQSSSPEHAFGLGADHRLSALSYIADKTSGVYSYANQDIDRLKDSRSVGNLTSVDSAMGVQIELQAREGVAISSLESGGHQVIVGPDGRRSLTIYIHDLYAGEQKNFIVNLTVPEGKEELLTVSGWYTDPENSDDAYTSRIDVCEVSVLRPNDATTLADEAICPEVAAELARLRMPQHPTKDSPSNYNDLLPDGPGQAVDIPAKQPDDAAKQADTPSPTKADDDEDKLGTVEFTWRQVITWAWASSYPYFCALPCLALLLLAAILLMSSHMTTTVMPKKGDGAGDIWNGAGDIWNDAKSNGLDISEHTSWPEMEKSLGAIMREKTEDARITPFLHSASLEDMSHTLNRYINLALVHAKVLGNRYGPVVVSGQHVSLLEETVDRLEAEKEKLRVKMEILAQDKAEQQMGAAATDNAACKEKNEAVARANTRIADLELHLQDKKVLADSRLSEVSNSDAHLKICSQRVDTLEVKVREMEGARRRHREAC